MDKITVRNRVVEPDGDALTRSVRPFTKGKPIWPSLGIDLRSDDLSVEVPA